MQRRPAFPYKFEKGGIDDPALFRFGFSSSIFMKYAPGLARRFFFGSFLRRGVRHNGFF
ncbi:hypothetical protein PMI03_02359, partial [Rhizobium sp. AP16]